MADDPLMYYASLSYGIPRVREITVKETPKQYRVLSTKLLFGPDDISTDCYAGRRLPKPNDRVFAIRVDALRYILMKLTKHIEQLSKQHDRAERQRDEIVVLVVEALTEHGT